MYVVRLGWVCVLCFALLSGCGEKQVVPESALLNLMGFSGKVAPEAETLFASARSLWRVPATYQGVLEEECSDPEKAVTLLSKAISIERDYAEAYLYRGKALTALGEKEAALSDLTRAIRLAPTPEAYMSRGLFFIQAGDSQSAIRDIEYAIKKSPDTGKYWNYLGVAYERLGDTEQMCRSLQTACEKGVCKIYEQSVKAGLCR